MSTSSSTLDERSQFARSSLRRSKRKPTPGFSQFNIRQQLGEQLRCLESRLEIEMAMVQEIQEFYRKKSDLEMEYSRNLDRLVRSTWARHKQEKQRREHWDKFSTFNCWVQTLEITRKQSHDHGILAEICGTHVCNKLSEIQDNSVRIFKKCKEIGAESHEDMLKILYELQKAMKTYHEYQMESKQAEDTLKKVQSQKAKMEQQLSGKSLSSSRKFNKIEKLENEKQMKYSQNKLKALHARNEYLLTIEVANAAINKYFSDDVLDLMDCMDFGYHNSIRGTVMIYQAAHSNMRNSHNAAVDQLNDVISKMDPLTDKQHFIEYNNQAFMLPKKFEFQAFKDDEVRQVSAQKLVQDQLIQSYKSSQSMLDKLKLDNDEVWKSLEATEKSLTELVNRKDVDVTSLFVDDNTPPKSPQETEKKRLQRLETEGYYLDKFRSYTLSNNRIARLQAKFNALQKAVGQDVSVTGARVRPPSLPPKPKKRRIGRNPNHGQPKLFGGNLDEYIEATGQEIPTVIKSCIRILNLYAMHHQGIFRIPGSQVEINDLKNAFEKGDDPLADEEDAREKINSAAGVLKMFFRELKPPLFPLQFFDELMACSRLDEQAKIDKIKELLLSLPHPIIIVMRYLFAFLNHLSEYSDENMMDPYNLAICFGPTLLPIPPDRDQVTFQTNVNEVIKTIIRNQDEIFPNDGGEVYEKCIVDVGRDSLEEEGDEVSSIQSDDDEDTEVYEATALYDFKGRTDRELSFKKGDNLVLYAKASDEWWEGAFAGKEGLIPSNYVAMKHLPDNKKNISSDDSKSISATSLVSLDPNSLDSGNKLTFAVKPLLETDIAPVTAAEETADTAGSVTTVISHGMSQSMIVESRHSSQGDDGLQRFNVGPGVELLKRQSSTPERTEPSHSVSTDDIQSMDSVLAEIMSDVRSLEIQQTLQDKRMSLPLQKSKPTSKHTPDLVLDLPEGSSSPQDGSDRDSPVSAAETFAKSNQGTLKKASSMPRNISRSEMYSADTQKPLDPLLKTTSALSTFQNVQHEELTTSYTGVGRKYSLEEHNIKPSAQTYSPPILEKPKPPIKAKPAVLKKPKTQSPDLAGQLETNMDTIPAKSQSS